VCLESFPHTIISLLFPKYDYLHSCCAYPTIWQNSQDVTKLISLNDCLGDLHLSDPLPKSERGFSRPSDQRTIRRICNDILLGLKYIKLEYILS
jgi:hypothetical protein